MAAVLMYFRSRRAAPAAAPAPAPAQTTAARSPEHMIASCEYELRQVRRDVLRTRERSPAPPAAKPREPFTLGAGLRGRATR
jgi:hypothetical protein